jgi:hypothetical protein
MRILTQKGIVINHELYSNYYRFFNNKFQYPIVIFYEPDKNFPDYHLKVRSMTNSSVFMQRITFELPSFLTKTVPKEIRGKSSAAKINSVIELLDPKPDSRTSLASYKYPPIKPQNPTNPVSDSGKWITL